MMSDDSSTDMGALISIIVPVYNVAKYLPRCIKSLIAQSHHNIEIILINDGSKDDSGKICNYYAKKDSRISVIHQENSGVSEARNAGIDVAKGEWVGFVDPDDRAEPELYKTLLNIAVKYKTAIAACGYMQHLPNGRVKIKVACDLPNIIPKSQSVSSALCTNSFGGALWNKIFDRRLLQKNNVRFQPHLKAGQDVAFVIEVLTKGVDISYIPKVLYHYYNREGSTTYSFNKNRLTSLDSWKYIINLVKHNKKNKHMAQCMYTITAMWLLRDAVRYRAQAYVPWLKKESSKYAKRFFFSSDVSLGLKMQGAVFMLLPVASTCIWQLLSNR